MTSGDEMLPTRRSSRADAVTPAPVQPPAVRVATVSPRVAPAAPTRWSRRRGVLGVFAAFAAMGFVVAYVGPAGMAISQASADEQTSLFASSLGDVQTREVAADVEPAVPVEFARDGYEVYVKPKPPPVVVKPPMAAFAPPQYTGGGSPADWMAAAGIAQSDWGYVDYIVRKESGWNPNATNRSSGACGLVQVYPCSKLANAYDPVVNLGWANGYANGRYGSWAGAYDFWIRNNWW